MKQSNTASNLVHRIFPVILPVPLKDHGLKGRERVVALSRLARQALEICSEKGRLQLGKLRKDANGVPMPFDGHYWSADAQAKIRRGGYLSSKNRDRYRRSPDHFKPHVQKSGK